MESIQDLRTQIDELTSAIDTHKRVLRDLENQRSKVQSDLNSRVDPMARLPFEITSDIFLYCVSTTPRPDSSTAPMIFLNICQLWRTIALSTPFLWAGICMDSESFPRGAKFAKLCRVWIGRARAVPLSFVLRGSLDRRVEPLIQKHAPQLQNFELFVRNGEDLQRLGTQGPFPSLRTLTIGADETNSEEVDFINPDECIEMLRAAPALLECDFDDVFYANDLYLSYSSAHASTHTSLRTLRLGNPQSRAFEGYHGNSACILQYVTLPSLESLDIADFDIPSGHFISFLIRSTPPLTSLRMVMPTINWQAHNVVEYFQLMPNLTDLELLYLNPDDDSETDDNAVPFRTFLEVLRTDLLPQLCSLTLWACFSERADYVTLIGVLTGRRMSFGGPFRSFQLFFPPNEPENHHMAPDRDVIVALRQFAKDGMHVHVGPQEHNFV
ncbi:hypothetical protein B0H12DRAFT_1127628 [Mycena haematopus]|nr:hypothetical protein B0H12DRAFT_1127628 [Mycena haematopus]